MDNTGDTTEDIAALETAIGVTQGLAALSSVSEPKLSPEERWVVERHIKVLQEMLARARRGEAMR